MLARIGEELATEDYAEDATGIAIVRYWGGGAASHDRELQEFLAVHRDAAWAIMYGGDGYTPGVIAHSNDAASLEAYLNLDTPG